MTIHDIVEKEIIEKSRKQQEEANKKIKRGRKKKKSKMYFTRETENAIILYNKSENEALKNYVYKHFIMVPFEKLAENIFNTFKFSYFDAPPEDVQNEVISNLIINLHKYEEGKGKAFSYFSVVAKNYLILINNGNYRRYKKSSLISSMPESWEVEDDFHVRQRQNDSAEFKRLMLDFWDKNINTEFAKKRDREIAYAVLDLFRRCDYIENFNKKAIYLQIREMANCKTQYITRVLNKMRDVQFKLLEEFRKHGHIDNIMEEYSYLW